MSISVLFKKLLTPLKRVKYYFTRRKREKMIAIALDTPEGKAALAAAMSEPIKNALMHQAIGSKLLFLQDEELNNRVT
jgi:hypothetical protein